MKGKPLKTDQRIFPIPVIICKYPGNGEDRILLLGQFSTLYKLPTLVIKKQQSKEFIPFAEGLPYVFEKESLTYNEIYIKKLIGL